MIKAASPLASAADLPFVAEITITKKNQRGQYYST